MPLRSPKMYSFIFGFQRLVWWPKWTPASSSSVITIAAKLPPLPFTELETLPRSGHTVLLPLLRPGVACQEPVGLQRFSQFQVVLDQRSRDAEPDRSGLSGHTA